MHLQAIFIANYKLSFLFYGRKPAFTKQQHHKLERNNPLTVANKTKKLLAVLWYFSHRQPFPLYCAIEYHLRQKCQPFVYNPSAIKCNSELQERGLFGPKIARCSPNGTVGEEEGLRFLGAIKKGFDLTLLWDSAGVRGKEVFNVGGDL